METQLKVDAVPALGGSQGQKRLAIRRTMEGKNKHAKAGPRRNQGSPKDAVQIHAEGIQRSARAKWTTARNAKSDK